MGAVSSAWMANSVHSLLVNDDVFPACCHAWSSACVILRHLLLCGVCIMITMMKCRLVAELFANIGKCVS